MDKTSVEYEEIKHSAFYCNFLNKELYRKKS